MEKINKMIIGGLTSLLSLASPNIAEAGNFEKFEDIPQINSDEIKPKIKNGEGIDIIFTGGSTPATEEGVKKTKELYLRIANKLDDYRNPSGTNTVMNFFRQEASAFNPENVHNFDQIADIGTPSIIVFCYGTPLTKLPYTPTMFENEGIEIDDLASYLVWEFKKTDIACKDISEGNIGTEAARPFYEGVHYSPSSR